MVAFDKMYRTWDLQTAFRYMVIGTLNDDNGVDANLFEALAEQLPDLDPELNTFLRETVKLEGADDRVWIEETDGSDADIAEFLSKGV